ncbi:capsule biosynthesis protein [Thalassobacter stenotrophicus]|uniref:capsule biosynthesis protein n=1 Tax=Thalassobacter stenotrophicus TaxID=266809 RepID=UPI00051FEBBD|nr:capsule biosynthesis protein [Thalassobacter stenotrophicus]KGK80674.1 capsule biosynthesis protein [Thalassobacter stenotrophicus]
MTMKPKPKKFRVRRAATGQTEGQLTSATSGDKVFETTDDGFGDADFRAAPPREEASPKQAAIDRELAAIRAEGLTGRQLRMARRVAQMRGVTPSSDFDAVRQLRAMGVDPFAKANMLELVAGANVPAVTPAPQTPQTPPPAPAGIDAATRAADIIAIQRDIAGRRRRKVALLTARLLFFVMLPTFIAAFYFYMLATPMFATKSEFVIQQADGGGGGAGGLGGLFSGTSMATQQDSISVQSYLLSRDALARLDDDLGFRAHFEGDNIDELQRLTPESSNEDTYKLYQRMVRIGYDPTEGVIKMEVIAADPATSEAFANALIGYAEEQVDQLTARLRSDQMQGAMGSFEAAEVRMLEAQQSVVRLQEQLGVVSADVELSSRMEQIGVVETELRDARFRLDTMMSNARPNAAQVENLERIIRLREAEISELRGSLTEGAEGTASLARISAELGVAQMDLTTRQALLQQAAQQLETARIEANRQVRYLSTSVPPRAPDEATYPRKFENTLLAFIIFAGIYLMISLTASILREQVSA